MADLISNRGEARALETGNIDRQLDFGVAEEIALVVRLVALMSRLN